MLPTKSALLPSCYLPPVSWFMTLLQHEEIQIESHEHFVKQTYRNRCYICTSNGILHLVVPLKGSTDKVPIKDVRIAYDHPWQHLHWKSLESAYRSSPYFEYYEDDFRPYFEKRYEFLFDFNQELLKTILDLMKLKKELKITETYTREYPDTSDYRKIISPKEKHTSGFSPKMKTYSQVFDSKLKFIPNLSILDLLFNQGPEARDYLE